MGSHADKSIFSNSALRHSQIRRQMWDEFVDSILCTERFSPGTPVSPLLKNQNWTWLR